MIRVNSDKDNAKGRGRVQHKLNYKFFTVFIKIDAFTYKMTCYNSVT